MPWLLAAVALSACHTRQPSRPTSDSISKPKPPLLDTPPATPGPTPPTAASNTTAAGTSSALPGSPIDLGPSPGASLGVVGVRHDDRLNLRARPGAQEPIVARLPPLQDGLIAEGRTQRVDRDLWVSVEHDKRRGWVSLRFVAYLGDTTDETAATIAKLGVHPEARTMVELGRTVARSFSAGEPEARIVLTAAPSRGDLGEVTYDVVGLGDDSILGLRVHVFGAPDDGRFTLKSVEVTQLCARGVSAERLCL